MSSVEAVGAYLRELREQQQMTAMEVVASILRAVPDLIPPPTPGYISKIERGKILSPGSRLLAAITQALGGNPLQINQLILNEQATAATGRDYARRWLAVSVEERRRLLALMQDVGPEFAIASLTLLPPDVRRAPHLPEAPHESSE